MDQIQDGCYINVTGLPFKLQVKTTLGNGNCAYSLLKITRNDFANLLSELVCTHVPNLSKVKANVRQTVLFDVNQAIARGNKENADGWELALAKEDAAARTSGLSDYALDTHNIIFYINNFVRLEPASFTETYHVANFYNTLDLGIGGLGVVAATALGIPIHIITIPDDGQFNEDLDNATVITVTGNQDLYDLTGLFEANQQGGALTSKLVQSEPGAKVLYLLFRNGNHYDLAIPVPKKQ
ncbi:hypothetical protein FACS189472_14600 [Alphaproteobacteria bacterium]|nr:hypothetical protein FACS189472_14600 [Alphaproteobacteria bacterium]